MGSLLFLFFPWGLILQAVAIVHFIRRRPDGYWLWIIIFFGGLGALIYIVAEVIPDAGLMRQSFKVFPRRRRIHELESAILDNPSAGNYEELADLYLEEGNYARARQCYDKAISSRTDSLDPFYRRGMAATFMGDFAAAVFQEVTKISTSSETYYNYACFLAGQQRNAEARVWAQRILDKKPTMPGYLRRRERPWFRKAGTLLNRLPKPV
jgi:hypothetical protein